MKKTILLIAFLTSYHISVVAQRNIEWQVKMGIYSDYYKYPTIDPALKWSSNPYTSWGTIGLGLHVKKWNILTQLNYDTKITIKQSNFAWQEGWRTAVRTSRNSGYIAKEGDYFDASYYYFNPINVLYQLSEKDKRFRIYIGMGLTGRYEVASTIRLLDGRVFDVFGVFRQWLFMPSLKTEVQYTFGKHFFLSTSANYAYFGKEPYHYLQLAFNTGLRF